MEKEKYLRAELQVTEFETEDIITSSGEPDIDYVGPNDTEIL